MKGKKISRTRNYMFKWQTWNNPLHVEVKSLSLTHIEYQTDVKNIFTFLFIYLFFFDFTTSAYGAV